MKRINLDFIRDRRKELHLSQDYVGKAIGFRSGAPAYNKYETGKYSLNVEHLPALANVLNCRIEDFFCTVN